MPAGVAFPKPYKQLFGMFRHVARHHDHIAYDCMKPPPVYFILCGSSPTADAFMANHPQDITPARLRQICRWQTLQNHVRFNVTMELPAFTVGMIKADGLTVILYRIQSSSHCPCRRFSFSGSFHILTVPLCHAKPVLPAFLPKIALYDVEYHLHQNADVVSAIIVKFMRSLIGRFSHGEKSDIGEWDSPFLIWCWERFGVTSMRLHRFIKSLLSRMDPTTARPLAGMIRSLENAIFIFFMMVFSMFSYKVSYQKTL